jgi:hypothetical protein
MSVSRLALQVGLIFCLIGAGIGVAVGLSTDTIIWRALLCTVMGAAMGGGVGALLAWLHRLHEDGSGLAVVDMGTEGGDLPAETPPVMVDEHGPGG